jgi:PBP1b-binding outer membrane lipoprotein LpoB
MKMKILFLATIGLIVLAGCNQTEETAIDQAAAKAQPGANTPPAVPTGAASEAQQRAEKEGK